MVELWSNCGRGNTSCMLHACVCVCVCVRVAHNLTHPDRDAQQTHKTSSPAACTSWRPPWPASRRGNPSHTPRTPKSQTRPMFLSIRHSKHVLAGLNSRLRFKLSQSNLAQLTPQPSFCNQSCHNSRHKFCLQSKLSQLASLSNSVCNQSCHN